MEFDSTGNDLDEFLRTSPELEAFLLEIAEQGADRWALRSKWLTGFNATHVEALAGQGEDGYMQGVTYASGYYARFREHGGFWGGRPTKPERIMRDFIRDVEG